MAPRGFNRTRRISPLIAATAIVLNAAVGAGALELQVVAHDGVPISGARVMVVGRPGTVVADSAGRCKLAPDPEPPFVLFVARADGVALRPVTVEELPSAGSLVVVVQASGEMVDVVSGVIPDLEVPPAAAATVLGRADLNRRNPQRLTDALENIPGTSRTGEGHAVVPGLRGLPKHRTLILLDDGRVTAERRAGPSATFLDPATVDEVEVIRGPGSVAYGSDAFGGVVRARSRMATPGQPLSLRYGLVVGSNAHERGAHAEVATGVAGGGLLIGAHYRSFDDYSSPRGRVLDSGATGRGFRFAYQHSVGGGMLRFGWRTDQSRDVGKPSPDSDQLSVIYPEEDSDRFNLGFERPGPGSWTRLSATLALDRYRLILEKDSLETTTEPRSVVRSDVEANDYELRFEAERPLGAARLVIGANAYGRFDLHSLDTTTDFDFAGGFSESTTEVGVERARRDDVGVFAGVDRELGRWGVAGGLRIDRVSSENRGGFFGDLDSSNSGLSGFLSLARDLGSGVELTAQVARGFRDPLLSDRYYRGHTGRGFVTGNPELEPETSLQYDLAIRHGTARFDLAGYAFLYRIDDLIERYREGDDYFFRNRGRAELTGFEVEARVGLSDRMTLRMGAHYLRGEVRDDGTATDDVPAPGAYLSVQGESGRRWWWMVRAAAFARDDRPGPTEQEVPAYEVVDAAVGARLGDAVELQLLGRNLLDSSYLGSADEDAVLAPGRSVILGLRGSL